MIYVANMVFESSSEDGSDDTEGHFTIVGHAESAEDMLDRVIPEKLKEIEEASELDYAEFYLASLVEVKDMASGAAVVGFVEGSRRERPDEENWNPVALDDDREVVRECETKKISDSVPFAVLGKPPKRLTK